jgi:hypothetical protein
MTGPVDGNCWFLVDSGLRRCKRKAVSGKLFCSLKTHRPIKISKKEVEKAIRKDDITFMEDFWI